MDKKALFLMGHAVSTPPHYSDSTMPPSRRTLLLARVLASLTRRMFPPTYRRLKKKGEGGRALDQRGDFGRERVLPEQFLLRPSIFPLPIHASEMKLRQKTQSPLPFGPGRVRGRIRRPAENGPHTYSQLISNHLKVREIYHENVTKILTTYCEKK